MDYNKLWKILRYGNIQPPYLPPEKSIWRSGRKLEPDMEQGTGSKPGKEYKSWEMPGWMKHKLESRLSGEISITSDMQMTPPLWQKAKSN